MSYIVTMHMGKATRIFRDVATGCLNSESEFVHRHILVFLVLWVQSPSRSDRKGNYDYNFEGGAVLEKPHLIGF